MKAKIINRFKLFYPSNFLKIIRANCPASAKGIAHSILYFFGFHFVRREIE
jgi:hypothetical protein